MKLAIFFRRDLARRRPAASKTQPGTPDWTVNDWADLPHRHPRRGERL